jgi:hypothetical protein
VLPKWNSSLPATWIESTPYLGDQESLDAAETENALKSVNVAISADTSESVCAAEGVGPAKHQSGRVRRCG